MLVKDIYPGSSSSSPQQLTNVGDTLFFTATDAVNGQELWKSDGTAEGTVLVKDIYAGTGSSRPMYLTDVGGTLYSLNYDKVCAANPDPIEKKPFFHVLPGSDALTFGMLGCDFHCGYCQNWVTSQMLRDPDAIAPPKMTTPQQLVDIAIQHSLFENSSRKKTAAASSACSNGSKPARLCALGSHHQGLFASV